MEWEKVSTDEIEQRLAESQALQSRMKATDLEMLEELDRRPGFGSCS
jgi:hypothetical protein